MPLGSVRQTLLWLAATVWLVVLPPLVGHFLRRIGLLRPNYRSERIPVGYGLVILFWAVPVLGALFLLVPMARRELAAYLAILSGMGVLGFVDDLWGDRSVTGLRGHFRAFLGGVITTGFVKAVGGALLSLLVPRLILEHDWPDALLDGAVIGLTANALNLLDLRPGRAGAVFLVLATALTASLFASRQIALPPPLLLVMIPALLVYERDARARVMMGDVGSNLLGGALGLAYVLALSGTLPRLVALTVLLALHVVAERFSLTRIIERNPLLKRLDAMTGRR